VSARKTLSNPLWDMTPFGSILSKLGFGDDKKKTSLRQPGSESDLCSSCFSATVYYQ
jgi:hypothetical protein